MMLLRFPRPIGLLSGSFLVASVAVLSGCSDNETRPGGVPFPNDVGTRWVYASYDSLASKSDTVTVEVVEKKSMKFLGVTQLVTVWSLSSSQGMRTQYVTTSADTVQVWDVDDQGEHYPIINLAFAYVFPLALGKEWPDTWSLCGEKARVVEQHLVEVPGRGQLPGYLIMQEGFCLNVIFSESREFVPGVGLTSVHWLWDDLSVRNETWRLLDVGFPRPVDSSPDGPVLTPGRP